MEMPVIWYPLFNSVPEKKDNTLGVVRKKDVINHVKNQENRLSFGLGFRFTLGGRKISNLIALDLSLMDTCLHTKLAFSMTAVHLGRT